MAKKKAARKAATRKKQTRLDQGIAWARKEMPYQDDMERMAIRYAIICNLIETLWRNRHKKEFYKVDYCNLAPFVSPQSREIANFIDSLYEDEWHAYQDAQPL